MRLSSKLLVGKHGKKGCWTYPWCLPGLPPPLAGSPPPNGVTGSHLAPGTYLKKNQFENLNFSVSSPRPFISGRGPWKLSLADCLTLVEEMVLGGHQTHHLPPFSLRLSVDQKPSLHPRPCNYGSKIRSGINTARFWSYPKGNRSASP